MFFMRVGVAEMLVVGGLILLLIIIPALAYWKSRRSERDD
jgi:hypothetical protein